MVVWGSVAQDIGSSSVGLGCVSRRSAGAAQLCTARSRSAPPAPPAPRGKAQPAPGGADHGDRGCVGAARRALGPPTLCVPSMAPHHFVPVLTEMGCSASRAVADTPTHPHAVGPGAFGVQQQERTCGKLPCFPQPHQPMVYRPRGINPRGPGSTQLWVRCTSSFDPSATSRVSPSPRDTSWLRVPAARHAPLRKHLPSSASRRLLSIFPFWFLLRGKPC